MSRAIRLINASLVGNVIATDPTSAAFIAAEEAPDDYLQQGTSLTAVSESISTDLSGAEEDRRARGRPGSSSQPNSRKRRLPSPMRRSHNASLSAPSVKPSRCSFALSVKVGQELKRRGGSVSSLHLNSVRCWPTFTAGRVSACDSLARMTERSRAPTA